ncbi:hypothetical protein C7M84_022176 [Penaeus vannamei]|uniref:Uncharacterized protein n=1 Tax=Penaeus vannamei TaxID=6689 RepID=A0A423U7D1_PENVA|nr:hypothetical protein C7M84_022176 [Penaeus vannamei]
MGGHAGGGGRNRYVLSGWQGRVAVGFTKGARSRGGPRCSFHVEGGFCLLPWALMESMARFGYFLVLNGSQLRMPRCRPPPEISGNPQVYMNLGWNSASSTGEDSGYISAAQHNSSLSSTPHTEEIRGRHRILGSCNGGYRLSSGFWGVATGFFSFFSLFSHFCLLSFSFYLPFPSCCFCFRLLTLFLHLCLPSGSTPPPLHFPPFSSLSFLPLSSSFNNSHFSRSLLVSISTIIIRPFSSHVFLYIPLSPPSSSLPYYLFVLPFLHLRPPLPPPPPLLYVFSVFIHFPLP